MVHHWFVVYCHWFIRTMLVYYGHEGTINQQNCNLTKYVVNIYIHHIQKFKKKIKMYTERSCQYLSGFVPVTRVRLL